MLADRSISEQADRIEPDILLPATARHELIGFVAHELPRWRDHPDRKPATSETTLTDQLCSHLNSEAYYSTAWSHVQFRTEVPDEVHRARAIDLAAKPCGGVLIIEGRRHSHFDTLFPIECKRLPTPKEKGRDEREYVITEPGTTGGIQRFKFGFHGAAHRFAAMIAYVQDQTFPYWIAQVNGWIRDLSTEANSAWDDSDVVRPLSDDPVARLRTLNSHHKREGGLEECELRHLWIRMN